VRKRNVKGKATLLVAPALVGVLLTPAFAQAQAGPTFSFREDVLLFEGGVTQYNFFVELGNTSNPYYGPLTVDYATSDGTATGGADYVATSGTLTFDTPSEQTITVTTLSDAEVEPDETFFVNLSNPQNISPTGQGGQPVIVDDQGVGTIRDGVNPEVCGVGGATPGVIMSTHDGEVLVGTSGPVAETTGDQFCILNNDVTVYTQGSGSTIAGQDYVYTPYAQYGYEVTGLVVHADVMSDGITPVPSNPQAQDSCNVCVFVRSGASGVTVLGSPDMDAVDASGGDVAFYGYGGNDIAAADQWNLAWGDSTPTIVMHGGMGNDSLKDFSGDATLTLDGGPGTDTIQEWVVLDTGSVTLSGASGDDLISDLSGTPSATLSLAAAQSVSSTRAVNIKGGRGGDRIKASRHYDFVYAGRGYDVCRVVTLYKAWVNRHVFGCEVIKKLA
jgi:hypothetical protein